ncbi:hypothetical protein [Rhizobium sp. SGZ-381]|uniref:hypothetical protein n=1 Tax=Rhizobium sp. SGZ-381 TaxID=3342800 RepID=UPI00366E5239
MTTDRDRLRACLLDTLIPGGKGFPPASGVARLERLAFRPNWTTALQAVMSALPEGFETLDTAGRRAVLEGLEQTMAPAFQTLIEALYSVYYTDPRVLAAVSEQTGYRNPPQPAGYVMAPFDDSVLATVRNHPQSWRPTTPERSKDRHDE